MGEKVEGELKSSSDRAGRWAHMARDTKAYSKIGRSDCSRSRGGGGCASWSWRDVIVKEVKLNGTLEEWERFWPPCRFGNRVDTSVVNAARISNSETEIVIEIYLDMNNNF